MTVGWPSQIRCQQQSDEDKDSADGGDDVSKREETDLRIKTSEPAAHGLASAEVVAEDGCCRSATRSFATMCDWQ